MSVWMCKTLWSIQGVFPPRPHSSEDRLRIHRDPDQDRELTEEKWMVRSSIPCHVVCHMVKSAISWTNVICWPCVTQQNRNVYQNISAIIFTREHQSRFERVISPESQSSIKSTWFYLPYLWYHMRDQFALCYSCLDDSWRLKLLVYTWSAARALNGFAWTETQCRCSISCGPAVKQCPRMCLYLLKVTGVVCWSSRRFLRGDEMTNSIIFSRLDCSTLVASTHSWLRSALF